MHHFNGNLNEHNQKFEMTAFLFFESMEEKKQIFVKSSHFVATV